MNGEDGHNRPSDLILNRKNVLQFTVVALRPEVGATDCIDELARYADAIAASANTSFQHVAHAQLAADKPDVGRLAFVLEARVAGDDEEFREPRQLRDDVFRDAVAEVVLTRVAAEVGEGEDGDRRFVG